MMPCIKLHKSYRSNIIVLDLLKYVILTLLRVSITLPRRPINYIVHVIFSNNVLAKNKTKGDLKTGFRDKTLIMQFLDNNNILKTNPSQFIEIP